jgi:uncharacterized protein (TIGR00299 family) protein
MALGALLDAGADLDEVRTILERLPVSGWELEAHAVTRGGVGGTKVDVRVQEHGIVRTHAHIVGLVEEARLPSQVRDRSLAVFAALAEAEGRIHRKPPSQVHFHEVGGMDAIIDVVGTCAALESLDIDVVRASAIATGVGMVRTQHGMLPNPAPAVVELLRGAPTYGREVSVELTTPTGAAFLAALASGFGALPRLTIESTGFGAGSRELQDLPNLVQAVVGEMDADDVAGVSGQPVVLLEVNVDDVTGEVLAHTIGALLDAGAHDAWITPIVMKKGRPAHTIGALADPVLADQVARVLTDETGSFGVRGTRLERWPSARTTDIVEVDGLPVRIKVGPGRAKAEHDDAARVARTTGTPLRDVTARAEATWRGRLEAVRDDGGDEPA